MANTQRRVSWPLSLTPTPSQPDMPELSTLHHLFIQSCISHRALSDATAQALYAKCKAACPGDSRSCDLVVFERVVDCVCVILSVLSFRPFHSGLVDSTSRGRRPILLRHARRGKPSARAIRFLHQEAPGRIRCQAMVGIRKHEIR